MDVYVTAPATGNPPALLAGRFDPMHGTFALHIGAAETIRSKRTRKTVAIPFFNALRKDLGLVGAYAGTTSDFRSYIAVWFAAHGARELVVFNGKVLYPATMASVFEYAATVPTVTFVTEPGDLDVTIHAIREAGVEPKVLAWESLLDRLPVLPTEPPLPVPEYTMEHLPVCDFLVFLGRTRRVNTEEVFAPIKRDYEAAYRAAEGVEPHLDAVVAMLAGLSRETTSTAQMLVHLRGAQTALFTRGWYLSSHLDKTLGTLSAVKPPTPTEADWKALLGYTPTRRPAVAALYLLDVPRSELATVTVDVVQRWVATGQINGLPIPARAKVILEAHLHRRAEEGAASADPYFGTATPTAMAEDLTLARRHLSLPVDGRVLRKDVSHSTRPLHRIGLDLKAIA